MKYSVLVTIETSEQFYKEYDNKEEAEKIKAQFEEAGATVELK